MYDPIKAFRYQQMVRHRPSHTPLRPLSNRFWQSRILRRWASSQDSDIALILGNYHSRIALRNMVVDIIEQLQTARIPVLLAAKPVAQVEAATRDSGRGGAISLSDLIKSLVCQGLQLAQLQQRGSGGGGKVQTERSMARACAQYLGTESPRELFQLLEAVLCDIHEHIYLVIDLGVLVSEQEQRQYNGSVAGNDRDGEFPWLQYFLQFFSELSERSNSVSAPLKPKVKVLLVSYDAFPPVCLSAGSRSAHVVTARTEVVTARSRKAIRHHTAKHSQMGLNLSRIHQRMTPVRK